MDQNTGTGAVDLRGQAIIVTGAASGIGAATARLLHHQGALPVLADRDAVPLEALAGELGGALAATIDVSDPAQADHLAAETLARHGHIAGLVNNAGISAHRRIEELDIPEFALALRVNVLGVAVMMRAVLPAMRAVRFGRIVNVSSGTTRGARPGTGPYAATKAAVNVLSEVARAELADYGIDVSVVLPSVTATHFRGGEYRRGEEPFPGIVTHGPEYPARAIIRALRTGEDRVDVPPGPERADAFIDGP